MKDYYHDYAGLIGHIRDKKLFLWGTGNLAPDVVEQLAMEGINDFAFVNSNPERWGMQYMGRTIYSPSKLFAYPEKAFVMISCGYANEISPVLEEHGYEHYCDYIDGVNLENEFCLLKYADILPAAPLTLDEMTAIEQELYQRKIPVQPVSYRDEDIETLERAMEFEEFYHKGKNPHYKRKMCEYLLNYKLIGLDKFSEDDIYVDVGSSTTPAVMTLREKYGFKAYGVDLCKSPYGKEYYLQENAASTSFADHSVSGITVQASYGLFINDTDMKFLHECSRILKPGGKVCISPMSLYKEYISLVSPQFYHKGYSDKDAKEYLRRD